MTTIRKTLSALAIAAATLTAATLASGSTASANPFHFPGHGPVVMGGSHGLKISCFACNVPRPHPKWNYYPWRFHHWGYYPWHFHHWGYYPWRYRWYWERYRYRFGLERPPVELAAVASPNAAVSAPAPVAAGPQACLTEQKMPDGSVVFEDVCKRIMAVAPPPSADPPQQ
jgi:hypothetical protein